MKTIAFWLGLGIFVFTAAWIVRQKEDLLAHGRTVLLELRPRDPRSLMQGDYMALRYALADQAPKENLPHRGKLVVKIDSNNVGHYARLHDRSPMAADEQVIEYRDLNGIVIGAESYFFQEGTAARYGGAKYAELRISPKGECLLVALCDESRTKL